MLKRMKEMEPENPIPHPHHGDDWCEIGRYRRVNRANEHGLVILSMGVPYWLMPMEDKTYVLYVETVHGEEVRDQLKRYEEESRYWPPRQDILPTGDHSLHSLIVYGVILLGFFVMTTPELLEKGRLSARLVVEGEWWRILTALTLHADWGHLMGNLVAGCFFAALVSKFLGYGVAWLAILISGAAGNGINAWVYYGQGHLSIGASTAVFAALGLLAGIRLLRQFRLTGWRWPRQLWAPFLAGAVLLGFLGTGGERTDVMAHLWGFLTGLVLGGALAKKGWEEKARRWKQTPAAAAALTILAMAWLTALR